VKRIPAETSNSRSGAALSGGHSVQGSIEEGTAAHLEAAWRVFPLGGASASPLPGRRRDGPSPPSKATRTLKPRRQPTVWQRLLPCGSDEQLLPSLSVGACTCIYCLERLTAGTRKAHHVPCAIGGRSSSRLVCCTDCNNALSPLERTFCEALADLTAMIGVLRGDGEESPPMRVVDPKHGGIDLWGGHPRSVATGMRLSRVEDGAIRFQVSGLDHDAAALMLAHVLRSGRKTPDDLVAGNGVTLNSSETSAFPGPIEFTVDLYHHPHHARVVAKIALEMLSHHRPELSRRSELHAVARYIRRGDADLDVQPDWATRSPSGEPRAPFHSCEVWSAGRYLLAKVVLYGAFAFTASLSTEWEGGPITAVHVLDPVNGKVLLDSASEEEGPMPLGWPSRAVDATNYQTHASGLAAFLGRRMRDVTAKAVAKNIMNEWLAEIVGRPPDGRDFARLQDRVESEIAFLNKRQDQTISIDRTKLLEKVREQFAILEKEHGVVTPRKPRA
jgi:hypothetical protein